MERAGGDRDAVRRRALVVCAHLRPSRDKRKTTYFMQPLAGLHVASLIDPAAFEVRLHHEDWHGPFDTRDCSGWDLVFLTGLQPDFDRMRQLSYYFRRAGSVVVAGGSVCTSFPEFASDYFDSVCSGGVESVPAVVSDYLAGQLRPIYRAHGGNRAAFVADYGHFTRNGINPSAHLLEASRGCRFRCTFCAVPNEVGGHVGGDLAALAASIDSAIRTSPWWSFRRLYPLLMFYDNNFADDLDHLRQVVGLLDGDRRIRGWAALVTQNVLQDRDLVAELARRKCVGLFVGLESLDPDMLRRYRKKQNLSSRSNVFDDIAFAERQGIAVSYGYLFDPRHQTAAQMEAQIGMLAQDDRVPMPVYLSVVAPLAGTESFWEDLDAGRLAPNLMMRELDGETIAYATLADDEVRLAAFLVRLFRRPWTLVGPVPLLRKTVRRIVRARTLNPIRWLMFASANLHCFAWSHRTPVSGRSFLPGRDPLDPQYDERPAEISAADRERYFAPVRLTDANGRPAAWLLAYSRARVERVGAPRVRA